MAVGRRGRHAAGDHRRDRPGDALSWVRSIAAGSAGTAVLSLCYEIGHRVARRGGSLDYDDSLVPGRIVASILDLPGVTARQADELGLTLRWSYGSMFGLWHGML